MQDQHAQGPEQHRGGYGDSTGGQDPNAPAEQRKAASATGREDIVSDPMDADEALGNRTGGYGGNPASTDDKS